MLKKLYKNSPKRFQRVARNLYGTIPLSVRYGKVFRDTYNLLETSQWWSKDRQLEYQRSELEKVLRHCYENVPYYTGLFNQYGFNPYTSNLLSDFQKIPFISKELIETHLDALKARNISKSDFIPDATNGTTGDPMKFFIQRNFSHAREWAFVSSQWAKSGYHYNHSSKVILRNHTLPENKLFIKDKMLNGLVVDTFHMTDAKLEKIIEKLNVEKIPYIHTYPSVIAQVCDYILRTGHYLTYSPEAVFPTSECLYPGQRELIETTLKTKLNVFYGHSEKLVFAGDCEESEKYHISSEYGYMELVDENGKVILEPGIKGEIVATGFNNYAMPFIRYKTGDYTSYSHNQRCSCGRNYKLIEPVDGKWMQEMLVKKNGSRITVTSINLHSESFSKIRQFQYYQDTPGKCILKVVKKDTFTDQDKVDILSNLKERLGEDMELTLQFMDHIPRTPGGKYKLVEQKLLKQGYRHNE